MNIYLSAAIVACAFVAFIILNVIAKNKRPVLRAFVSLLSGGAALAAVNLTSAFTGVYLPLSFLTVAASLAGGIPGVTALLALNLFF